MKQGFPFTFSKGGGIVPPLRGGTQGGGFGSPGGGMAREATKLKLLDSLLQEVGDYTLPLGFYFQKKFSVYVTWALVAFCSSSVES